MTVFVCVLAGLLAGVGTGFAGLSAAVFISPMLITFLHVDSFSAIGIALASDVLASAASAATYAHNGNTDLKRIRPLIAAVLVLTVIAAVLSHLFTGLSVGESVMKKWLLLALLFLGAKLAFFPARRSGDGGTLLCLPEKGIQLLGGCYIGFLCGFQGTGGGLMLLFVLNILLGMDYKRSVGSSVCVMTLTALVGAASHFLLRGVPDLGMLAICVIFTLLGALAAAKAANRIHQTALKRMTGALMLLAGAVMLAAALLGA